MYVRLTKKSKPPREDDPRGGFSYRMAFYIFSLLLPFQRKRREREQGQRAQAVIAAAASAA